MVQGCCAFGVSSQQTNSGLSEKFFEGVTNGTESFNNGDLDPLT